MEVIQVNLNHCEMAQDLLMQSVSENQIDVALIAEPFRIPANNGNWISDKAKLAAVFVCGKHAIQEVVSNQHDGIVIVKINNMFLCSFYAPPRWSIEEYEEKVDLITSLLQGKNPVIISGDFNAWAEEWGSRYTNARGQSTLEALAKLEVNLANDGETSTF